MIRRTHIALLSVTAAALTGCGSTAHATAGAPASTAKTPAPPKVRVAATFSAVGPGPHFAGVERHNSRLFVSHPGGTDVTVLNATTGALIGTVTVGNVPHTVQVNQSTRRVYVTLLGANQLAVIDGSTDQVLAHVPVGTKPHGLAIDPAAHQAWVTNIASSSVSVVDTTTNQVVRTIPLPAVGGKAAWPWGVAIDARQHLAYVTGTGQFPLPNATFRSSGADVVYEINTKTDAIVRTVTVGPGPWNAAVDARTGTVYTGVTGANQVVAIHGGRVVARIPVAPSPHGIVIDPAAHLLFVANSKSASVSVIDTRTNRVVQTVPVGTDPQGMALDPHTHRVYVENQQANTVSVLSW